MQRFNSRFVYCRECGSEVFPGSNFCQSCGCSLSWESQARVSRGDLGRNYKIRSARSSHIVRSPGLAAVASFFIPGLGEIYAGKVCMGLILMIFEIILIGLSFVHTPVVFLCVIIWVYSIKDSYNRSLQFGDR